MSIAVANITSSNTFQHWVDRTNQMATAFSSNTVTADATSTGSLTTGNVNVNGHVRVIVLAANTVGGGTLAAAANLTFTTNTTHASATRQTFADGAQVFMSAITSTDLTAKIVDSWSGSTYRAAKYLVSFKDDLNTGYGATEIMVLYDGSAATWTEYGTLLAGATVGTFSANVNAGTIRLYYTPTIAASTVKFHRTAIAS